MMSLNKSLFRRLLVSYLITVILGIGVVGLSITFFTKGYFYEVTQEELLRKAKKVNLAIQNSPEITENTVNKLAFLDQSFDTRIWLFDQEGRILSTSMKDEVFAGKSVAQSMANKVLQGQDIITELQFEGLSKPMLSVVVPWGKNDQIYGGIVLHAPIEGLNGTFGYIRETILWATLLGVLISTAMVSYLSWSISRPLQKIERTALEIGRGNLNQRVNIENSDEIGDLAQTINSLADKLETLDTERVQQDKIRSDFLANISHELRTPLTAIQGFLEALQDGLVEEEEAKRKYYHVMYEETMHLNRLVDDLMDLIKLENKEVTLYKAPVDVEEIMKKISFTFTEEAAEKNTSIEVKVASSLPKIYADKDRLTQILQNLAKNAVKFTERGKIELLAEQEGHFIKMQVKDSGIGIGDEDLSRIWERFFKGDRVRSKVNKGTGLGLAIVKELVALHHGRIIVQSELGYGTTFSIWIPHAENQKEVKALTS